MVRTLGYDLNIPTLEEQYGVAAQEATYTRDSDLMMGTGSPDANVITQDPETQYSRLIQEGYAQGKPFDVIEAEANEIGIKTADFANAQAYYLEQGLALNESGMTGLEARAMTNLQIAQEVLTNRTTEVTENRSWVERASRNVGSFIAMVSPIGTWEDILTTQERESGEIMRQAARLGPADFKTWFEEYAQSQSFSGLALGQAQANLSGRGFDSNAENLQALSILGVASVLPEAARAIGAVNDVRRSVREAAGTLRRNSEEPVDAVPSSFGQANDVPLDPAARGAAIAGPDVGGESAAVAATLRVQPDVASASGANPVRPLPQPVQVATAPARRVQITDNITQELVTLQRQGYFGPTVDLQRVANETVSRAIAKTDNSLVDYKFLTDDLGNIGQLSFRIGNNKGQVFKATKLGQPPQALKELAQRDANLKIVQADPDDATKGFYLEGDYLITPNEVTGEVATGIHNLVQGVNDASKGIFARTFGRVLDNPWIGSSRIRDNQALHTMWQNVEASQGQIKRVLTKELRNLERLSATERGYLSRIIANLRDGPDSELRQWYTETEFANEYRKLSGELPSERTVAAYETAVGISDASYILTVSSVYQKGVRSGYTHAFNGSPMRVVDDVPSGSKVYNVTTGIEGDIKGPVYKLLFPQDGHKFITGVTSPDVAKPTDFVGYNAGGPRTNPYANFFITARDEDGNLKSVLTAEVQGDADLARQQISNLWEAKQAGRLSDEVIEQNNIWNPSIQTAADVEDYFKGVSATSRFYVKPRDGNLLNLDNPEFEVDEFFNSTTAHEFFGIIGRRENNTLTHFGGMKNYQDDPVNTILGQFSKTEHAYAQRLVTFQAMRSWLDEANKSGVLVLPNGVHPQDYYNQFLGATLIPGSQQSNRLAELRGILTRRLSIEDDAHSFLQTAVMKLSDIAYTLPKGEGVSRYLARVGTNDPANALLKIGFHSTMGFFSPDQLILQAFHSVIIGVMTGDFKAGFVGSQMLGLMSKTAGDPKALELGIARMAKAHGMSVEDMTEFKDFLNHSGRLLVDGDAIEANTGVSWGVNSFRGEQMGPSNWSRAAYNGRKWGKQGLEAGLVFFRKGERTSRVTAMSTAFREFKNAYPGRSALTPEGIAYITRREQDLTFNMDTASRAMYQQGLMKIPTQWMSYGFRTMEAIFVGKGLTQAERARLAAFQITMFGAGGAGMYGTGQWISEKLGVEAGSFANTAITHGLVDALLNELDDGAGISLGSRLSGLNIFSDVIEKFSDSPAEILAGPSGGILWNLSTNLVNLAGTAATSGSALITWDDSLKTLRSIGTIDKLTKAYQIWNYGFIRTRTGTMYEDIDSRFQAMAQAIGFSPLEMQQQMAAQNQSYKDYSRFQELQRNYRRQYDEAWDGFRVEGELTDSVVERLNHLDREIALMDLPLEQKKQLMAYRFSPPTSNFTNMIRRSIGTPNSYQEDVNQRIGQ